MQQKLLQKGNQKSHLNDQNKKPRQLTLVVTKKVQLGKNTQNSQNNANH